MGGGASKTQTGPVLDPVVYAELLGKVRRAGELMIAHLKIDPDEPEGAASWLRAFGQLDSNHDGLISYEDLHDVLTNLDEKLTDEEVGDVLRAADLDGNGQILGSEEFCYAPLRGTACEKYTHLSLPC